ncbi:MAG: DsbA family protein [Actinomycetota bacterium]
MAAEVRITEYTDPGCPWAWSAEPFRRRLQWLYGDSIDWRERMVGLSESPEEYEEKGFTTEKQSSAFAKIAKDHGMPIDTSERPRMAATLPACRAVVAAQLNAPERARQLLRCLRVRHFGGALLDEPETIDSAAAEAELDSAELGRWMEQDETERVLREEMDAARQPIPAARVLDEKLAGWSGGRRYTCPSYEIERTSDGVRIAVPGFQPFSVYDVILANLVPRLGRRDAEPGVVQVLRWAGTPLATREVAELTQLSDRDAREQLGRVASERHLGFDGLWKLSPSAA